MEIRLDDKVVVITGSAQGLGAEIAAMAVDSGVGALFLVDRNAAGGEAHASRLADNCSVAFMQADLAETDAPARVIEAAVSRYGRIDCLVNAAGLTDRAAVTDGTHEIWDKLYAVNARAPYFLMQGAIKDMLRRGAPGSIINILSMNAHCGAPDLRSMLPPRGRLPR